jgi:hypothetical protein
MSSRTRRILAGEGSAFLFSHNAAAPHSRPQCHPELGASPAQCHPEPAAFWRVRDLLFCLGSLAARRRSLFRPEQALPFVFAPDATTSSTALTPSPMSSRTRSIPAQHNVIPNPVACFWRPSVRGLLFSPRTTQRFRWKGEPPLTRRAQQNRGPFHAHTLTFH